MKHVEMSCFLHVRTSNITNLGDNKIVSKQIPSCPLVCFFGHVLFMLPECEISCIKRFIMLEMPTWKKLDISTCFTT